MIDRPVDWVGLPRSEILAHFEVMVRNFQKRPAVLRLESDIIENIRDTFLPKLISGEIRVPDIDPSLKQHTG